MDRDARTVKIEALQFGPIVLYGKDHAEAKHNINKLCAVISDLDKTKLDLATFFSIPNDDGWIACEYRYDHRVGNLGTLQRLVTTFSEQQEIRNGPIMAPQLASIIVPILNALYGFKRTPDEHIEWLRERERRGIPFRVISDDNANKVPAANFVGTLAANASNESLSDAEFREFVRNTLPIVEYDRAAVNRATTEG